MRTTHALLNADNKRALYRVACPRSPCILSLSRQTAKGDVIAAQMFMVVALRTPTEIKAQIVATVSAEGFYELKPDTWLVRYNGTTRELAEKIGVRQGTSGTGLVVSITGYSGRAPGDIWEWLKLNWETDG